MADHCVNCSDELILARFNLKKEKLLIPICRNTKCPNFGLLQMGLEVMSKEPKE